MRRKKKKEWGFCGVLLLGLACGPQQGPLPGNGENGSAAGASWLVQSWTGTVSGTSGNLSLVEDRISVVFYPDQSFFLKRPDATSGQVKGLYRVPAEGQLQLQVTETDLELFPRGAGYRAFNLTRVQNSLNITDQGLRMQLRASDHHDSQEEEPSRPENRIYRTWLCHDASGLWKVSFFSDRAFLLSLYADRRPEPWLARGEFTETVLADQTRQIGLGFYYKPLFRQLNFEFSWKQSVPSALSGAWYQGNVRPATPAAFSCVPG